ncbi:MAG: TIR domain-containing protein [Clostridiales bacterium]|nr:TIR domain-containing protein [Clostridiales bacterium]
MATIKCKICGGMIEFPDGASVGVCDSCGLSQALPRFSDDSLKNMFERANALRQKCEFDKAEEIYNKMLEYVTNDPEIYWGIVLCRFGIEYVEDPRTMQRIPTCHRASFEALSSDFDYHKALDCADFNQKAVYEEEARKIDIIQRNILNVVQREQPYDIFICYKETDENGKRTTDAVLANDIYYQLTQEGFKVFYSAISLEDKLGQEYEPYIFAALNSAKVMLVIGSKPEYFESVWVRNEWSRFIKLTKSDRSRLLIPCYKDMDPYDLPSEFAHLQAQDMGKIGFINDLIRGIKKIIVKEEKAEYVHTNPPPVSQPVQQVQYPGQQYVPNQYQQPQNNYASMQYSNTGYYNYNANNGVAGQPPGTKNKWITFFLCLFLGFIGAHKFYEGKIVKGILYILTFGGFFGIGVFIDLISILFKPTYYTPKR